MTVSEEKVIREEKTKIDYTPEQAQAVNYPAGDLLVSASGCSTHSPPTRKLDANRFGHQPFKFRA